MNGTPEIIQDNSVNNNLDIYFSFLEANIQGTDQIRLLGNNVWGFEDIAGGDMDFNDLIIRVNLDY